MAAIQGITVDRAGFLLDATISVKAPCRVATTGNITLVGEQTVDGVAVVADDRVLVRAQDITSENAIYVCKTGDWQLARDFYKRGHVFRGTRIFVTDGTANARTDWHVTTSGQPRPGREAISFARIAAAASIEVTPTGGISSTDLQSALAELDTEKAAASHNHTSADVTDFAEASQDVVGALLTGSEGTGSLDWTYDDAANTLSAALKIGSVGSNELAATAVTPGAYTAANITVDADGRITAAASGTGSSGMTLLASGSVSATTLDLVLTSYTSYRALKLILSSFVPVTDAQDLWLRFSTDGGGTFATASYRYAAWGVRDGNASAPLVSTSAGQLIIGSYDATRGPSNVAAEGGVDTEITLHNQAVSRFTRARWHSGWMGANGETVVTVGQGTLAVQQDTDAIRIMFASGDIASGDYALYGLA